MACSIKTVAMESTGVYWIALFQILEGRGLEVCLVNARHVKGVPGRKTDIQDCQWLQYLHSVGLLRGSFRPGQAICAVRSVLRHRDTLLKSASRQVLLMQKALTQMNLQLHNVISDITGLSGLAIIDAILMGEREPSKLSGLCHARIKASRQMVAKSLVGDYRPEHLFCLQQALESYRHFQSQITACDERIETMLARFDSQEQCAEAPSNKYKAQGNQPAFDVPSEMHRILGVDLTAIPGMSAQGVLTFFCEVGPQITRFPSSRHFASWLGLCPDNRISGGKILSSKTRNVRCRLSRNKRHFRLSWKELHIEGFCLAFKPFEALEAEFDFVFSNSLFEVLAPVAQHSIDQTGEMVSHGNNGFGSAQAAFEAAILCPERGLAVSQTLRAQPQRIGSSIVNFARGTTQHFAAADRVVRAEPEKRTELFFGVPSGHVQADFGDNDLSGLLLDAGYFRQVHSTDPMKLALEAGGWGFQDGAIFELREMLNNACIALGDFALSEAVGIQGHAQGKKQLLAPVAVQALGDALS
jgi:transposase